MSTTYLIKIQPANHFFFGMDVNLGSGLYGNSKTYFIKSLLFPQQTSLLGLVRHTILLQTGAIMHGVKSIPYAKRAEATINIGPNGFGGISTAYGKIEKISPVFISTMQGNEHYFLRSAEFTSPINKDEMQSIIRSDCRDYKIQLGDNVTREEGRITNYSYKDPFMQILINEKGNWLFLKNEFKADEKPEAFRMHVSNRIWPNIQYALTEAERVGIRKGENGKTEEEAYYKQVFLRFANDYCFGCYVTLAEDILVEKSMLTTFGKEKSTVKLIITKNNMPDWNRHIFNADVSSNKILLLSDCVVPDSYLDVVDFGITNLNRFGYLRTTVQDENYGGHQFLQRAPTQQTVLSRGSVMYLKDLKRWERLADQPLYQNIGMNQYVAISNLSNLDITPIYFKSKTLPR